MVAANINHPSIIAQELLEQGESYREESRPVYERLAQTLRDANDGRLVTRLPSPLATSTSILSTSLASMPTGWYPDWLTVKPQLASSICFNQRKMNAVWIAACYRPRRQTDDHF